MRARSTYVLIGFAVLLTLCLGAGGAILLPGLSPQTGTKLAAVTRSPTVASPTTRAASAADPPVTETVAGQQEATPTSESAGSTPTEPPLVETPTVPPPAPTDTPVPVPPTAPPAPPTTAPVEVPTERVGGPVSVPNNHKGTRWVTLQVGHWHIEDIPTEMRHLEGDTGASAAGVQEVDVNLQVARLAAQYLYERGYSVDILDATIPMSYTTDLFLALHCDGNPYTYLRGFKAVAPWNSVSASDQFVGYLYTEYGKATGLPVDPVTTDSMADYYAFSEQRYWHAIQPDVPAALLEMGFVTNSLDREVLANEQDRMAWGIANGVDRYFHSGAAGNTPTPYPSFTPSHTPTSTPTNTATSTSTFTPTSTPTSTDTPTALLTGSIAGTVVTPTLARPSPTPMLPRPTQTPVPTATPLLPIITADGRWFAPLAPNGRDLPQPGSDAAPVLLSESTQELPPDPDGRQRLQIWQQFYEPQLGYSVWKKAEIRYIRR